MCLGLLCAYVFSSMNNYAIKYFNNYLNEFCTDNYILGRMNPNACRDPQHIFLARCLDNYVMFTHEFVWTVVPPQDEGMSPFSKTLKLLAF